MAAGNRGVIAATAKLAPFCLLSRFQVAREGREGSLNQTPNLLKCTATNKGRTSPLCTHRNELSERCCRSAARDADNIHQRAANYQACNEEAVKGCLSSSRVAQPN